MSAKIKASKQTDPSVKAWDGWESLSSEFKESIAFNLRLAQSASFSEFRRITEEDGLKPGDYAVLRMICENPGITPSQISTANSRDKSTLTPHLKSLERQGLISRRKSTEDRRVQHLFLTPVGQDKVAVLSEHAKSHDAALDALMTTAEKRKLLTLLVRIARWQGA
ncbi:MarR family winged helix-turn-helix transcriptional regulator [Novosphingobium sp. PP1Y]|uniref:MarR family winged helix-turn-helix transcriptional regulator n=1 Tax=Novosphingobium sp. PP1Y TaxID=702113 RepID=UPI00020EF9EE|nr:MarR family transcriptional regulator [Novosphingobium sp. PP1Y]CCA90676.1 MarR family transcriptional regulator [Novosphingobium sp. PP1Y]